VCIRCRGGCCARPIDRLLHLVDAGEARVTHALLTVLKEREGTLVGGTLIADDLSTTNRTQIEAASQKKDQPYDLKYFSSSTIQTIDKSRAM